MHDTPFYDVILCLELGSKIVHAPLSLRLVVYIYTSVPWHQEKKLILQPIAIVFLHGEKNKNRCAMAGRQLLVEKRKKELQKTKEKHVRSYAVCQFLATPAADSSAPSSIPLIVPDNMVYDKEANTLTEVKGRKRSKLVPVPEALELLKQLQHKQVAVLAICGPCRSGKSYILSKMIGSPDAFKLGHKMLPETHGIWMGTSYLDFGDYAMLLLDTEGIDAVSAKGQDDVSILVMTVLLSSFLIYNSMQVPKRADVDMMG